MEVQIQMQRRIIEHRVEYAHESTASVRAAEVPPGHEPGRDVPAQEGHKLLQSGIVAQSPYDPRYAAVVVVVAGSVVVIR